MISFEQLSRPEEEEEEAITLTAIDLRLMNGRIDDLEMIKLMEEKGISFDSGFIRISVDGEVMEMNTNKSDFGTIKNNDKSEE